MILISKQFWFCDTFILSTSLNCFFLSTFTQILSLVTSSFLRGSYYLSIGLLPSLFLVSYLPSLLPPFFHFLIQTFIQLSIFFFFLHYPPYKLISIPSILHHFSHDYKLLVFLGYFLSVYPLFPPLSMCLSSLPYRCLYPSFPPPSIKSFFFPPLPISLFSLFSPPP